MSDSTIKMFSTHDNVEDKDSMLMRFINNRVNQIDNVDGYRVYLFVSRNKDNVGVTDFKQRSRSFILNGRLFNTEDTKTNDVVTEAFKHFASLGVSGELSRMYMSINTRNKDKIRTELAVKLIQDDSISDRLGDIESITSSIAARKECANEHKWLLDIDTNDKDILIDIIERYLICRDNEVPCKGDKRFDYDDISLTKTPHGYALVTSHGFDTRKLLKSYNDVVTVRRDDMLYIDSIRNN